MLGRIDGKQLGVFISMILLAILLWWTPIIYPFKVLVVFLHEICHALAAIITTMDFSSVKSLEVQSNESGVMQWYGTGGSFAIVASAGYVGTSIIGSLLLYFSTSKKSFSAIYLFLSFLLVFMTIYYVKFLSFGFFFGMLSSLVFFILYIRPLPFSKYIVQFVGIMCCCYSIYDFADFGDIYQTDAGILANQWGLKIIAYPVAFIWIALSLGLMFYAFVKSVKKRSATE